jgi:hypothetical protein
MGVYLIGMHLRNVYPIDVPLSRAFLAGVYPINMHLIDVHLIDVHLMGVHLITCIFYRRVSLTGLYPLQACIS